MATNIVAPGGAPTHPQHAGHALQGQHIVPSHLGCFYPPAIEGPDLLAVNFDIKHVEQDGIYLVELVQSGVIVWRGARRFQRTALGLYIDQTGESEYLGIASPESLGLRVVGYVVEVYKPAQRIAELAATQRRAA